MNSATSNLIFKLNQLHMQGSPIIKNIHDLELLLSTLQELDAMVEMDNLKDSVVKQIKFILINKTKISDINITDDRRYDNIDITPFDGHMVHTVIYGPPGVGKTKICGILVKIWLSLGILKRPRDNNINNEIADKLSEQFGNLVMDNAIKAETIANLQTILSEVKKELVSINFDDIKTNYSKKVVNQSGITDIDKIESIILDQINKLQDNQGGFDIRNSSELNVDIRNPNNPNDPNLRQVRKGSISFANIRTSGSRRPSIDTSNTNIKFFPNSHKPDNKNTMGLFKIVGREDFVSGFLGQTAPKTEKLLTESLGKVLFIDEAYALVNDDRDSYGKEALVVLNRFMTEHSEELIVIFAGYKELMEQTIFKYQPGLRSRCTWAFEIEGYSQKGLATIFTQQLRNSKWDIDPSINLINFFADNIKDFPSFGRDTNKLVFYCKICYNENIFDNDTINSRMINHDILLLALTYLQNNQIKVVVDTDDNGIIIDTMYM